MIELPLWFVFVALVVMLTINLYLWLRLRDAEKACETYRRTADKLAEMHHSACEHVRWAEIARMKNALMFDFSDD